MRRPCRSTAGSIFCQLRWWRRCSCTTCSSPRVAAKSYGDSYINNSYHPTSIASLAAPPPTKAEHHHLFRHVALQCDLRDVFLLGRTQSKRRSFVGRDRQTLRELAEVHRSMVQ